MSTVPLNITKLKPVQVPRQEYVNAVILRVCLEHMKPNLVQLLQIEYVLLVRQIFIVQVIQLYFHVQKTLLVKMAPPAAMIVLLFLVIMDIWRDRVQLASIAWKTLIHSLVPCIPQVKMVLYL